tara:strand:- start:689 stop:958 length:270 start_codon:yes stop_codon:yes gene_type:complete
MKNLKKYCVISLTLFTIFSCGKCVECTQENNEGNNIQYQIIDNNGDIDSFGDIIVEICSDNFESKKDFKDYINELEEEYDYDCVNDFGN